jgi:hypothetical protein
MRTGRILSTMAVAATAVALLPSAPVLAATTAATGTLIKIGSSGKCVTVQGAATVNSAKVVQGPCSGGGERFVLVPVELEAWGTTYQIRAEHSGKCLNVQQASTASKAPVIQYTCSSTSQNNLWRVDDTFENRPGFRLRAAHTDKCLNVEGATTADGVQLIQYTCSAGTGSLNEQFYFPPTASAVPVARAETKKQPVAVVQGARMTPDRPGSLYYTWIGDPGDGSGLANIIQHLTEADPDPRTSNPEEPIYIRDEDFEYTGRPYAAVQADGATQVLGWNKATGDAQNSIDDGQGAGQFLVPWNIGGALASQPVLAPLTKGGALATFAVVDGALWYSPQLPRGREVTQGSWRSLGGSGLTGAPAFSQTANGVRLYLRTTAGGLTTAELTGTTLSDWTALGGTNITGTPSAAVNPVSGLASVFVRAGAGVSYKVQNADGSFPAAWSALPNVVTSGSPSAVVDRDSQGTIVSYRDSQKNVHMVFETTPGSGVFDGDSVLSDAADPATLTANDPTTFTWVDARGKSAIGFAYPSAAAGVDKPVVLKLVTDDLAKVRKAAAKSFTVEPEQYGKLRAKSLREAAPRR